MKSNLLRTFLLLALLLVQVNSWAQDAGRIESGFDTEKFPQVSFIYHSHNPEVLTKSDFQYLREGGENRSFSLDVLNKNTIQEQQTTLILWEDMAHNGRGQFEFTQKVLSGFFSDATISSQDKFAVSTFNRRKNTPSALSGLTSGLTSDRTHLLDAVQAYKHSAEHYPEFPNRSDMYSAIREGLDILQPLEGVKAIVVFTAGYSMKNSGSDSEAQVLLKAQRLHIPVYIFQYYYRSGVAPESEGFAQSTYGGFYSYKDIAEVNKGLISLYPKIRDRYYGHSYKISFTTEAQRGDEGRIVSMRVNGMDVQEQFVPPPFSLSIWIKENLWLTVAIAATIIILIALLILFIAKTRRKVSENKDKLAELEQKRITDKESAEQKQRELEDGIRKDKDKAEQERLNQKKLEEQERLLGLMRIKNLYPRLQCVVGNDKFTYTIDQIVTTLGRADSNDVILKGETVSREHAIITFTGGGFEVTNKSQTNPMIVNGQFTEHTMLRNADIIGLGEAIVTFFL